MGFISSFAQDLINDETIEATLAEVQCPNPRVVELEREEVETEEEIAA